MLTVALDLLVDQALTLAGSQPATYLTALLGDRPGDPEQAHCDDVNVTVASGSDPQAHRLFAFKSICRPGSAASTSMSSRTSSDFIGAWHKAPSQCCPARPAGVHHRPITKEEMALPTIAQLEPVRVTVGVDTHKDQHVAVAKDHLGRHLGETTVATTPRGYRDVLAWAESHGDIESWGVEGTGSYGAGLSRFLRGEDQAVIEINRPNRKARRLKGKSDPVDAEAAARAVLSGEATALPKSGEDRVEMIRALRAARSSAIKARTQAINTLKALVVSAPAELREQLRGLPPIGLVRTCARLRPGDAISPVAATKLALRSLAGRYEVLEAEIKILDPELVRLTNEAAPALVEIFGVGPETAGALLVTAGDNPERLRSEAAFAHLCGVSPIQASSGKTVRHRLNRGGDR